MIKINKTTNFKKTLKKYIAIPLQIYVQNTASFEKFEDTTSLKLTSVSSKN